MNTYVVFSGLYRFLCGMILLAINWSFATNNNNDHYLSLAIATCSSFVPALFIPLLIKPFINKLGGKNITSFSLGIMSIILIPLIVSPDNDYFKLPINFLLWCVFFAMESSWEMWFVDLSKSMEKEIVTRYSSISMTSNQCALMLGPLAAPFLLKNISYGVFYFVAVIASLMLGVGSYLQKDVFIQTNQEEMPGRAELKSRELLLAALVLVWPTLGTFNFMLPVHIAEQAAGEMLDVGILDTAMSIGMATIGFLTLSKIENIGIRKIVIFGVFILFGMICWYLHPLDIIWNSIGVFLLGIGFGGLRIELRSQLAQNLASSEVGFLVLRANAIALPILVGAILISRLNIKFVWFSPFILALVFVIVMIMTLLNKESKQPQYDNKMKIGQL